MAIDSAEKRKSISGIVIPSMPGVTPNSGKDQEWRQESGWSYSGILATVVVVVVSPFGVNGTMTSIIGLSGQQTAILALSGAMVDDSVIGFSGQMSASDIAASGKLI